MKKRFIAAAVAFVMIILVIVPTGNAADSGEIEVWVLCQPDSYVNIRERPSSRCCIAGYADCGDMFLTDGTVTKGFVHIIDAAIESPDAWISAGYIVYSEPVEVNQVYCVVSKERLACRRTINGDRRCWADNGDTMKVYWSSDEWSVTSRGFVKTQYIEFYSDFADE